MEFYRGWFSMMENMSFLEFHMDKGKVTSLRSSSILDVKLDGDSVFVHNMAGRTWFKCSNEAEAQRVYDVVMRELAPLPRNLVRIGVWADDSQLDVPGVGR
jgi:hypothetical protein